MNPQRRANRYGHDALLAQSLHKPFGLTHMPTPEQLLRAALAVSPDTLIHTTGATVGLMVVVIDWPNVHGERHLGTILSRRWTVLKPPGSYNTPMGLSRVIREQLRPNHDLFVTELGDYSPADIRLLTDLVHPRIGVLTIIGPEHLDRFKSMDRIVEAKEELLRALPGDGVAIINADDPLMRRLFEHQLQPKFRYAHTWSEGDVLMWDHIRTIHTAIADYDPDEPRLMKRCQVMADHIFDMDLRPPTVGTVS